MVVRWTLYDPNTSTTVTFGMNPNEGGTPPFRKTITYQATAAPEGRTLVFQGRPEAQTFDISGTLLTEADYDFFVTWWTVQNQMLLTDDLGREFWVVCLEFTPKRERAARHPWKHSYSVKCLVVDVPA